MFPHGETVTRLRATLIEDPYSDEDTEADWEFPSELDIEHCAVAAGGSTEPVITAREAVDSDFDVFLPVDADVTAQDRLIVRGLVCDVAGRPFTWSSPFTGWTPGTVAQCKIREG